MSVVKDVDLEAMLTSIFLNDDAGMGSSRTVLELEDPKLWPWPWPLSCSGLGLDASASSHLSAINVLNL